MTKCNLKENIKVIILKLAMVSNSKNDVELAIALNTNQNTFSSWKNTTQLIPIENLVDFCNAYGISLDWLLRSESCSVDLSSDESLLKIPYFEKATGCNYLNLLAQESTYEHIYLNRNMIKSYRNCQLIAIKMLDNQLEHTAQKDSTVIVNILDRTPKPYPQRFMVYIGGQILYKNIYENISSKYCLSSENKNVREETVEKDVPKIIGKIIKVLK